MFQEAPKEDPKGDPEENPKGDPWRGHVANEDNLLF
jgi:hypothetical protein